MSAYGCHLNRSMQHTRPERRRAGSAAANVGLHHGDVIVAVDGQELQSYSTLQSAVGGHQSGEAIELRVRRGSGELEDITVVRP